MVNVQKLKLLYLMKMLREKTSAEQGLTMSAILKELEACGVKAERKSVYRDIESLREFGLDVQVLKGAPAEYALVSREFDLDDMRAIACALQSSAELTQRRADALVRRLKGLVPERDRAKLDGRMQVAGRIKMQGESAFAKIGRINDASASKRKVSFRYFRFEAEKRKVMRPGNERYVETPLDLVCSKGSYYLVTAGEAEGELAAFRVDRMDYVEVCDEPAERVDYDGVFDLEAFEDSLLGDVPGEAVCATFSATDEAMDAVISRFGADVEVSAADDGRALVTASVVAGPALYGWLTCLGGKVRVVSPVSLAEGYAAHLRRALKACEA